MRIRIPCIMSVEFGANKNLILSAVKYGNMYPKQYIYTEKDIEKMSKTNANEQANAHAYKSVTK